jgi:glutamate carboxypeptidase
MTTDLRRLVEVESPSPDLAAVRGAAEEVASIATALRLPVTVSQPCGRPVVRVGNPDAPVLMLAHLDTVHPLGAAYNPWRVIGDRAYGLGSFDMKSGIVIGLHVLAAIGAESASLFIDSDEEIGSETSRELIEAAARGKDAVLVLEPSLDGALKTGRKGVSNYRLAFTGRAAHAGLEPEKGAYALLAMASCAQEVGRLADPAAETTVTPTVASAGTTVNVVPEHAELVVDVRTTTLAEQRRVDADIRRIKATVPGVSVEVHPGPARPPLEEAASAELFTLAGRVADELGIGPIGGAVAGGGSDGNFTAALGIPTLDGLGAVGAGAHTADEWVDLDSLPQRAALVAGLIAALNHQP